MFMHNKHVTVTKHSFNKQLQYYIINKSFFVLLGQEALGKEDDSVVELTQCKTSKSSRKKKKSKSKSKKRTSKSKVIKRNCC